jgi:hypothetical protein
MISGSHLSAKGRRASPSSPRPEAPGQALPRAPHARCDAPQPLGGTVEGNGPRRPTSSAPLTRRRRSGWGWCGSSSSRGGRLRQRLGPPAIGSAHRQRPEGNHAGGLQLVGEPAGELDRRQHFVRHRRRPAATATATASTSGPSRTRRRRGSGSDGRDATQQRLHAGHSLPECKGRRVARVEAGLQARGGRAALGHAVAVEGLWGEGGKGGEQ